MADEAAEQNGATPPEAEEPDPLADVDQHVRALLDRANGEAKEYRAKLRAQEEKVEKWERERESESERIVREAKEAGRAEMQEQIEQLQQGHRREMVKARVVAAAAGKLRDPADAAAHIDTAAIADEADDKKRDARIGSELERLLKEKPYLGAEQPGRRPPLVSQGARTSRAPSGESAGRRWLGR